MSSPHAELAHLAELVCGLAELVENPEPHPALLRELGVVPSRTAFTELFDFDLPPYTSFFLSAGPLLGAEPTQHTREFFATYLPWLETPPMCDHLGFLLSVLGASLGHGALDVARAHLWEQLAPVAPLYAKAAAALGPPEYRHWATLLSSTLERIAAELGVPEALPLHLRAAPQPAVPEEREALVEFCLSPGLSGVVITRRLILRASHDAQLPVRFGGRRFSFQSLLDADPRGTLRLVGQVAREQDRWDLGDPFAAVYEWWHERRRSTIAVLRELATR